MTTVNSWNEWDPLKHVIVGAVENANIPPMEPALEPKISKDSGCLLYTSPSPRDRSVSRMPSSA